MKNLPFFVTVFDIFSFFGEKRKNVLACSDEMKLVNISILL